jgi:hypothetical protein
MSLINDALKRAKLAQQQAPATTAHTLQLRQLEPAPAPTTWRVPGLLVPVTIAAVALFGLLFVWQVSQRSDSPNRVEAKSPPASAANTPAAPVTVPPLAPPVVAQPNPPAQLVPSPTPAVPETPAASGAPKDPAASTVPMVADAPPPGPPPLKLQAIIFNPRRPSALISGRIAFLGDKFGDLRVVGITRTSATLAGGGQTKVLSLPE